MLEMPLGRNLLIYTVLNTPSGSGSGSGSSATSGKRSNRSQTHFFSGNTSRCSGFLLIQLYYCDVFLFTHVLCCFVLSIKILPIRNRAVCYRFNANERRVLFVIECKLAGKRAMGASILSGSNHKGRVLFDVPRFEEVSSQVFPQLSHEHTSIRQSFASAETCY